MNYHQSDTTTITRLITIFLLFTLVSAVVDYPPLVTYPDHTYPQYRSLAEVIEKWSPDDPEVPEHFHETIQMFNYSNKRERDIALSFRQAEVPFKLYDVPEIDKVVDLWTDDYLMKQMQYDKSISVEVCICCECGVKRMDDNICFVYFLCCRNRTTIISCSGR